MLFQLSIQAPSQDEKARKIQEFLSSLPLSQLAKSQLSELLEGKRRFLTLSMLSEETLYAYSDALNRQGGQFGIRLSSKEDKFAGKGYFALTIRMAGPNEEESTPQFFPTSLNSGRFSQEGDLNETTQLNSALSSPKYLKYKNYSSLAPIYGAQVVFEVVKAAEKEGINPLVVFLNLAAEHTALNARGASPLFQSGQELRLNPNCKNSAIGDTDPRFTEPAYYLAQMRRSTFAELGLPFDFSNMGIDWKLSIAAIARYAKINEKMLGISSYSDPVMISNAYNGPKPTLTALQNSQENGTQWRAEYLNIAQRMGNQFMPAYVSRVSSFSQILEGILSGTTELKRGPDGAIHIA